MTIQYLLDTDWVIHYLNEHQGIVQRLDALLDDGLGLSIISLAELYEGVYYSRDPEGDEQDLNDFLRGLTILGIDEAVCKIFGRERGRLRSTRIRKSRKSVRISKPTGSRMSTAVGFPRER